MPKIFSVDELREQKFPQVDDLYEAADLVKNVLNDLHQCGEIVSASSYGSLFDPTMTPDIASDLDWIVIFKDLSSLFSRGPFSELLGILKDMNVEFGMKIMEYNDLSRKQVLTDLYLIKRTVHSNLVGVDLQTVVDRYEGKIDNSDLFMFLFSSYTRHLFEQIVITQPPPLTHKQAIHLLQLSVNAFRELYRIMIIVAQDRFDYRAALDFETYVETYTGLVDALVIDSGQAVELFVVEYRQQLLSVVNDLTNFDFRVYENFLFDSLSIVSHATNFVRENIRYFKDNILSTLNR